MPSPRRRLNSENMQPNNSVDSWRRFERAQLTAEQSSKLNGDDHVANIPRPRGHSGSSWIEDRHRRIGARVRNASAPSSWRTSTPTSAVAVSRARPWRHAIDPTGAAELVSDLRPEQWQISAASPVVQRIRVTPSGGAMGSTRTQWTVTTVGSDAARSASDRFAEHRGQRLAAAFTRCSPQRVPNLRFRHLSRAKPLRWREREVSLSWMRDRIGHQGNMRGKSLPSLTHSRAGIVKSAWSRARGTRRPR